MLIRVAGINHRTAPVAIREKAAISARKLAGALEAMKPYLRHGIILSTCNRTELYTAGSGDAGAGRLFFREGLGVPDEAQDCLYELHGPAAGKHLFRVAAGLESMIVGEHEVLGQVGAALEAAERAGTVCLPLRRLFQAAVNAGRLVREETGISRNAVSVSSVAVDLATDIVGKLGGCAMLVIGTGEAGHLVARAARERGIGRVVVAGRTAERAAPLAGELGGQPAGMDELAERLAGTDIVISCSAAPHYTLTTGQVKRAMTGRPGTPLVIIDIGVPRNIEPSAGRIEGVHLYNIDDLTGLAAANLRRRGEEMSAAEDIVDRELAAFREWWRDYEVRPVVKAMTARAEGIRRRQLEKTLKRLDGLNEQDGRTVDAMTKAIVKKLLDAPIRNLKNNGHDADLMATVRRLFDLEEEA